MELQKFLRNGGTVEELTETLHIKVKEHTNYKNLLSFKYSQIHSPMSNSIVRECRGVILDSRDNWNVVSRPYDKFFNIGELYADKIDWESAKVYEKLDGTLISLYNYDGAWWISTSGTPDGTGQVPDADMTFLSLFRRVSCNINFYTPNPSDDKDLTFMFELCSKHNRVITQHRKERIVLHGVRNRLTGRELDPSAYATKYGWECVKMFNMRNESEVINAANKLNGYEDEGFVIVDKDFNRVKVKSLGYVRIANIKKRMDLESLLEIHIRNEQSEFLSYFPEFNREFLNLKEKFDKTVLEYGTFYEGIKGIKDQKEFALKAVTKQHPAILFDVRKGRYKNVKECMSNMNIRKCLELILSTK